VLPEDSLPHHLADGADERLPQLMFSVGLPVYRRRLYKACVQQDVAAALETAVSVYSDM